jgi:NADH-quinone oxidoreductase subunit E
MDKELSSATQFGKVCDILDRFDRDPAKLIPILQAIQDEYRYLPEEILTLVATSLNVPPAKVYGVATFYAHFTLTPKGKHIIRICDGTACHVKGSTALLEAIRKRLGLNGKQQSTSDLLFTVETVSCLGACGLAPAVVIDDKVHGQVTPEKAVALVEELINAEA